MLQYYNMQYAVIHKIYRWRKERAVRSLQQWSRPAPFVQHVRKFIGVQTTTSYGIYFPWKLSLRWHTHAAVAKLW